MPKPTFLSSKQFPLPRQFQCFFFTFTCSVFYCQMQKTMNTWEISGMLIVKWPFTIKIRTCKQASKPQTKIFGFPFCGLVFSPLICCFIATQYRVFDKILSRWQKLWSRWRRKQTCGKGVTCKCEFLEKFGCIECISSILEQKLECLNRTQTSLNFGFIIQWQHMITLFFYFKTSRTFLFLHFMFLISVSNVVKTWCLILQAVQVIRTHS